MFLREYAMKYLFFIMLPVMAFGAEAQDPWQTEVLSSFSGREAHDESRDLRSDGMEIDEEQGKVCAENVSFMVEKLSLSGGTEAQDPRQTEVLPSFSGREVHDESRDLRADGMEIHEEQGKVCAKNVDFVNFMIKKLSQGNDQDRALVIKELKKMESCFINVFGVAKNAKLSTLFRHPCLEEINGRLVETACSANAFFWIDIYQNTEEDEAAELEYLENLRKNSSLLLEEPNAIDDAGWFDRPSGFVVSALMRVNDRFEFLFQFEEMEKSWLNWWDAYPNLKCMLNVCAILDCLKTGIKEEEGRAIMMPARRKSRAKGVSSLSEIASAYCNFCDKKRVRIFDRIIKKYVIKKRENV